MKRILLLAVLCVASFAGAQEIIEAADGSGSYRPIADHHGRYIRFEGSDGVVVSFFYDSPDTTLDSGMAIRVNDKVTLTVRYHGRDDLSVAGLPRVSMVRDPEERTLEIRADQKRVASFDYSADKYVAGISLPGFLTMRLTAPDRNHHVRQTLYNGSGKLVGQAEVVSSAYEVGMWRGVAFDGVAASLGFDPRSLSYKSSPVGFLTTGRDANQRVALYIVNVGPHSVGFTPDGVPRFYDIRADLLDADIAPGSDCSTSMAIDQNKAAPEHITLTADGVPGMYIEEPASGAIYAAWAENGGAVAFTRAGSEGVTPATPRF